MATTTYKQDKAVDGKAPKTGARGGELVCEMGVFNLALITTPATTDAFACLQLPAYHRVVDCIVAWDALHADSSANTIDVGIVDDSGDETLDYPLIAADTVGRAGGISRMAAATEAAVSALLTGYFATNQLVGFEFDNVDDAPSGHVYITLIYTPIDGWETLLT